jgi:hypothetical protein
LAGYARTATARRQNGVGHTTTAAIDDNIFNDTDFFATLCFNFCADDLARLNVA